MKTGAQDATGAVRRVHVRAPASTSNLGPGFDCLGLALTLYNTFIFEPDPSGKVTARWRGQAELNGLASADGRGALVYQAACETFRRLGVKPMGLRMTMGVHVPLARGLGSSATAILAGVAGANALTGSKLSPDEVFQIAARMEGHPDNVAASLYGGLTAAALDERHARVTRYAVHEDLRVVVAVPAYPVATEKSRAALPKEIALADAAHNLARVPFIIQALTNGAFDDLAWAMEDRLHEPYRLPLARNGRALKRAALGAGAMAVVLSGSGPSLAAFCCREKADAVAEAMNEQQKKGEVLILGVDNRGLRLTVRR